MSEQVKLHKVVMVPVGEIKLDPDNPNIMSEEQMEGLRESMRRFGYLDPVIVDQNFLIADGEHRLTIYKELGKSEVPCYVLQLKDEERRLLRQTMNKLRGGHDLLRDAAELKVLFDKGRLDDLAKLIAGDKQDYLRLLENYYDIPYTSDDSKPTSRIRTFPKGEFHTIIQGDVRKALKTLPDNSVDCVITSPPYWALRDYGKSVEVEWDDGWKGQLGLEPDFRTFVKHLVECLREVKRVLAPHGAMYLNLGDTYWGGGHDNNFNALENAVTKKAKKGKYEKDASWLPKMDWSQGDPRPKSLLLIPERVAIALEDDGWIVRNAIIWHKPNHMPTSVKDRYSTGYEFIFFVTKEERYYFDLDAVREPHKFPEDVKRRIRQDKEDGILPFAKGNMEVAWRRDLQKRRGQHGELTQGEQTINQRGHSGYYDKDGELLVDLRGKNPGDVFGFDKDGPRATHRTVRGFSGNSMEAGASGKRGGYAEFLNKHGIRPDPRGVPAGDTLEDRPVIRIASNLRKDNVGLQKDTIVEYQGQLYEVTSTVSGHKSKTKTVTKDEMNSVQLYKNEALALRRLDGETPADNWLLADDQWEDLLRARAENGGGLQREALKVYLAWKDENPDGTYEKFYTIMASKGKPSKYSNVKYPKGSKWGNLQGRLSLPDPNGSPPIDDFNVSPQLGGRYHGERAWASNPGHGKGHDRKYSPEADGTDYWDITTRPFPGAHFATFPPGIVIRPLKASCPAAVCTKCGKPVEHVIKTTYQPVSGKTPKQQNTEPKAQAEGSRPQAMKFGRAYANREDIGIKKCDCNAPFRPGIVLDPFAGSGTVGFVAKEHHRSSISVEINPRYCDMAKKRIGFDQKTIDSSVKYSYVRVK